MTYKSFLTIILAAICLMPWPILAEPVTPTEDTGLILTGSANSLWIVRSRQIDKQDDSEQEDASAKSTEIDDKKEDVFDILVLTEDGGWKWFAREEFGKPVAAVVEQLSLHMLSTPQLNYTVYHSESRSKTPGRRPRDPRWPDSVAPLAMCVLPANDGNDGHDIVAIIHRVGKPGEPPLVKTTTQPAAKADPEPPTAALVAPMPADKDQSLLTLFRTVDGMWTYAGDISIGEASLAPSKLSAIATSDGLTMLVSLTDKTMRIDLSTNGAHKISPFKTDGSPVGLCILRNKPTVVSLKPSPSSAGNTIILKTLSSSADTSTGTPVKVTSNNVPVVLAEGIRPMISSFGENAVIFWKANGDYRLLTAGPSGAVIKDEIVQKLNAPPPDTLGLRILEIFTLSVLVLTVIIMLVLRPKEPLWQFALPAGMAPAPLLKRITAFLIDFIPFSFLGDIILSNVTPTSAAESPDAMVDSMWRAMSAGNREELLELVNNLMGRWEWALAIVIPLGFYIAYCIFCEYRFNATLGKKLMRLHVVANRGKKATLPAIAMRNLMKVLELQPSLMLILLLIPILGRKRMRLGDLFARTIVAEGRAVTFSITLDEANEDSAFQIDEESESKDDTQKDDAGEDKQTPPPK